jgi:hypothetical protein
MGLTELIDTVNQKLGVFDNIQFTESDHTYLIDGVSAMSVTTIISKYIKPFDSAYHAPRVAEKRGTTTEAILDLWGREGEYAGAKGTISHAYIENQILGQEYIPEYPDVQLEGRDMKTECGVIEKQIDQFLVDTKDYLIPVRSEIILGDIDSRIAGMSDQFYYNLMTRRLEVWDWKTNKKVNDDNTFNNTFIGGIPSAPGMPTALRHTKLTEYSLQLSLYRAIIEKNAKLKVGDSHIVWFNENNDTYKEFKCLDLRPQAKIIMEKSW